MKRWVRAAALVAISLCSVRSFAQGGFYLPVGDGALRADLQLLADADVITIPLMAWPIPRADIAAALDATDEPDFEDAQLRLAFERIRAKIELPDADGHGFVQVDTRAGEPALLHDFDTVAREEGELSLAAGISNDTAALVTRLTAATSPADNQVLRGDGSELTVHLGNWLLGANTLDRWWGPGQESSLILSNNARPIPALALDRATSKAFDNALLRWIGPWRFSALFGQMDSNRQDIPRPLFLGLRVEFQPLPWLDLALSRTNQFCGKGRRCDLQTLKNLLLGNDNVGIDVTSQRQPGNGLAGFDLRIRSPWSRLPLAIYAQGIGEDESHYHPDKYLGLFGAEFWTADEDGGSWRSALEYSDTTCSFNRGTDGPLKPHFNCAYNNNLYNVEGYRYLGRTLGYTTDNDARLLDASLRYARPQGDEWRMKLLAGHLNRDQIDYDPLNTVAHVSTLYRALEGGWRGSFGDRQVQLSLGAERLMPRGGESATSLYGFLSWQRNF